MSNELSSPGADKELDCSGRTRLAERWTQHLGTKVTAPQVALCLCDLKLARLTVDPRHLDSLVDLVGYAVTCPPAVPRSSGESLGLIGIGFGLGKRAGRGALGWLARPARFCGGNSAERGMRPDVVVVVAPEGQRPAGVGQAVEDLLVQAFVAQATVE